MEDIKQCVNNFLVKKFLGFVMGKGDVTEIEEALNDGYLFHDFRIRGQNVILYFERPVIVSPSFADYVKHTFSSEFVCMSREITFPLEEKVGLNPSQRMPGDCDIICV